jgi:hypothetical protein
MFANILEKHGASIFRIEGQAKHGKMWKGCRERDSRARSSEDTN